MEESVVADTNRTISPKMQFKGKVVKTSLAGAVLDIGIGKPAFLHITQVVVPEKTQIKRVEDVLKVGEEVDVWVKRITRKDGEERIELTMNRPLDLEWRDVKVGNTVKGKVVRLEKFGAFVEIGAERPGLVHISEMAHGYVKVATDVVKEGDEIEAQIIEVDKRKKQIKLSMKALLPEPVEVVEEKPKPASPPHTDRKSDRTDDRRPRRKKNEADYAVVAEANSEPAEPEPTVMELAMKAAMEKAKDKSAKQDKKKSKLGSKEQEDLLARTLDNKVQTN